MQVTLRVRVPMSCMGALYGMLDRLACTRVSEDFGEDGSCVVVAAVEAGLAHKVAESVGDMSKGQGAVERCSSS